MAKDSSYPATVGVILAGGAAKRLGGRDKGLLEIAGKSLLMRVMERLSPQCVRIVLSANGDPKRFEPFGLDVIADEIPGRPGPLGGILAALDHLASHSDFEWLLSAPADCPFLPANLAIRLHAARGDAPIAISASEGNNHPIVALWHVSLRADLYHALVGEDVHKAGAFVARHPHAVVEWPLAAVDPFFNVNTADDFAEAVRLAAVNGP